MSFDEFQHHARLHVVEALDAEETAEFHQARREFGPRAEDYIFECRKLNSAFALSLRPRAPRADAKSKLMELIRGSLGEKQISSHGL